jgi:hypothetical protein
MSKLINYLKGKFMSDETLVPPVVEPVVAPEVPVTEPVVESVVAPAPGYVKLYYQQKEVVKRTGTVDANGDELCELEDGSTTYVPKSVLGDK